MLKYNIKLGESNIKRDKLVWSEKYIAPDLSFVSGVTSQHYHIDKQDEIAASIGLESNFSSLLLQTENVTRNGYIVIKNKQYKIKSEKTITYTGGVKQYGYVEIGGVIYYVYNGDTEITVNNWLKENWEENESRYVSSITEGDVKATIEGNIVKLDTVVWIEDETVTIDGFKYFFDRYDEGIKYYEGGLNLSPDQLTDCDNIVYNHFSSSSDYIYVTKFILTKHEDNILDFDRIGYCNYFYYIFFKNNYCPIRKSGNIYVCDIPIHLIDSSESEDVPGYSAITVSVHGDYSVQDRLSQLKDADAYVEINGVEFDVNYAIQDGNSGDEIAIYLTDQTNNLSIGEKISIVDRNDDRHSVPIYSIGSDEDKEEFVLYNGGKYPVKNKLINVVNINGIEHNVFYPNGTNDGVDALVEIEGKLVPMQISNSGTSLKRYGYVVTQNIGQAHEVEYKTTFYPGVEINGKKYRVIDGGNMKYIVTDEDVPLKFTITNIQGSSMLICEPDLNDYEFSEDFVNQISFELCDFVIARQSENTVYSQNNAFGTRHIKPGIGFVGNDKPRTSNDYYDLFSNLVLYINSGYIQIPLPLEINVALNGLQEETVKRDFYEVEKEKAITPITDMEKDVYLPKYITGDGKYYGSNTTFKPISEIEVNLHFRTRNIDPIDGNWKVNDGFNNIEVSGECDNWFCTDFYPYHDMLNMNNGESADDIQNSSDLMGLLWFTNDDVFYQRDKISKSFLRFSYYDSTDPNNQSLLSTSTVFMDEHTMYKKFIDNSRKNVNSYATIKEREFKKNGDNLIIPLQPVEGQSGHTANKVSVMTEYYGKYDKSKKDYVASNIDSSIISKDEKRISSRFTINNKYETETSSEGYYLYMFREYSKKLRPKPIYMKVEFNHAGIGRTIPFIIPMKWSDPNTSNECFPVEALTLKNNLTNLKKGYPLSFVYAQTYIPLYAVYDFKNKEYGYVFDSRYVTIEKDNKIRLNLFELKIANEEQTNHSETEDSYKEERVSIRNNKIKKGVIDINAKQFNYESN